MIAGLASVFMCRLQIVKDIFVFFVLKTVTAIELSGVISIVKIVEKKTVIILSMSGRFLKTKVKILYTFNILRQDVPVGDNPVTD